MYVVKKDSNKIGYRCFWGYWDGNFWNESYQGLDAGWAVGIGVF